MILCDTNVLIEFYKNNHSVVQELHQIGLDELSISAITRAELYFGALNKVELRKIQKHLSLLREFPIDADICDRFLQLMEKYSLSHKLGIPDAVIAATALERQLELYTFNLKDFQFIMGLTLYTPSSGNP